MVLLNKKTLFLTDFEKALEVFKIFEKLITLTEHYLDSDHIE